MNIKRYDLTEDVATGELDITPVPERMEGRFVTYEDYHALQEKLSDAVATGIDLMRNAFISRVENELGPNADVDGLIKAAQMCVKWADMVRNFEEENDQ